MRLRVPEVSPTASTVLVDDVRGVIWGGPNPAGSPAATAARRSATSCRSRKISLLGWKMTVMTEIPWIEPERSDSIPCSPLRTFSIGWVTSASTCSGERPGASVWIWTCGGANSGKTS